MNLKIFFKHDQSCLKPNSLVNARLAQTVIRFNLDLRLGLRMDFLFVPFLGLIFWVTFCSSSNTLTFDSKVYIWKNMSGEKYIVIVGPLPLVGAHTKMCPKY